MRRIIGCMSGTSIDGIDAALIQVDGHGLEMSVQLLAQASYDFAPTLADSLRAFAEQHPMCAGDICQLQSDFAQAHCQVIDDCLQAQATASTPVDLIVAHGQTVYHQAPQSWQMLNPAIIAQHCQSTVLSDLRACDLAAGGQGAPITPLADYILFHQPHEKRSVCNLGGFCNITHLPADNDTAHIQGYDLCACNHILDHIARHCLKQAYDVDGAAAQAGTLNQDAAQSLLAILTQQFELQRSLGTGDEIQQWLNQFIDSVSANDLAHSACWAIAQCILQHCRESAVLIAAGGGCANACLMQYLSEADKLVTSEQFNVPIHMREAMSMAVLGALAQDEYPITLPQITHAKAHKRAGTWTNY